LASFRYFEAGWQSQIPWQDAVVCQAINIACEFSRRWIDSMRPLPKDCRNGKRIDSLLRPPGAFVASPMVQPANRNGELVADLAPHRPLLGKLDVVGIRRSPQSMGIAA
jgi:hypothetical protein